MLFRHPALSEVTLLAGILPLTFCTAGFATGAPSVKLPSWEHVVGLVTPDFRDDGTAVRVVGTNAVDAVESGAFGGLWVGSRRWLEENPTNQNISTSFGVKGTRLEVSKSQN